MCQSDTDRDTDIDTDSNVNTDSDPNTVAAAGRSEQPFSVHVIWERIFELAR
jgi:hypothetical protein